MVPLRVQSRHMIKLVTVGVSHKSDTLGHILFLVIYHRLLFPYKFELIWININLQVFNGNDTVFFIICNIN